MQVSGTRILVVCSRYSRPRMLPIINSLPKYEQATLVHDGCQPTNLQLKRVYAVMVKVEMVNRARPGRQMKRKEPASRKDTVADDGVDVRGPTTIS